MAWKLSWPQPDREWLKSDEEQCPKGSAIIHRRPEKQAEDAVGQHGQGLLLEASGLYAGATDKGPEIEGGNDKVLSVASW